VRSILEQRNRRVARDADTLVGLLQAVVIPGSLEPYRQQLIAWSATISSLAAKNLEYLRLGEDSILKEILGNTQRALRQMRLMSADLVTPVLRGTPSDRICLTTIGWLHANHREIRPYPPAVSPGTCAVWPLLEFVPIYFFPALEQQSLLYQPLMFHEFGHVLYGSHKPEMDDLVGDLQRSIQEILLPVSQRNDLHAARQAARRQVIVNTWYRWTQEIFCDAVGFQIGGPCFLHAFSEFVGGLHGSDFYRPESELRDSEHPVTALRVRLLVSRVRTAGYGDLAAEIEQEWDMLAESFSVPVDYHGYYVEAVLEPLSRAIEDMLTEASPRKYADQEASGGRWVPGEDSPIRLFNWAWQTYRSDSSLYDAWERDLVKLFVDGAAIPTTAEAQSLASEMDAKVHSGVDVARIS
jgi:hypothetical protein